MRCCLINKFAAHFVVPCLLMILAVSFASGQSRVGFLGKRHSISIDALQYLMNDKINIGYKFCVSNRVTLEFGYDIFSGKGKYDVGQPVAHFTKNFEGQESLGKGRYDVSGSGWDFRMTVNSPLPNMPQPIGFYWGFGFGYDRVTLNNYLSGVTNTNQYSTETIIDKLTYDHRMINIYLVYGKNTSLGSGFTLDAALEIGIRYGNLEASDSTAMQNAPEFIAPQALPWNTYDTDLSFEQGQNKSYFKIILLPQLRLSYMF
jgi:hypothetical protein